MSKVVEDAMKAGYLLATNLAVTDGPFTESRELVGGFAILQGALCAAPRV